MICLTAGVLAASLAAPGFTLTWIHSVEKTEIQEDYLVSGSRLLLTEERIKTSGAGFDPQPGSVLADGWWLWHPNRLVEDITLAMAAAPGDWRICVNNACHPVRHYLPDAGTEPVRIAACSAER